MTILNSKFKLRTLNLNILMYRGKKSQLNCLSIKKLNIISFFFMK